MVKPALYKSHLYNHLNNGANPPKSSKWIANDYIPSTRIFVTEQSTSAEKHFLVAIGVCGSHLDFRRFWQK